MADPAKHDSLEVSNEEPNDYGGSNLRQIRAFIAVFEEGSFTAAARRENATQSGISQHIARLEAALGSALFTRSRDGVGLTVAGQRYYERCVPALRMLEAAAADVRGLSGRIAGQLRAGLMPAFTRAALAPALQRFSARYPDVSVQVTEAYSGALTEMVRADELDFALVPAAPNQPGLRSTLLSRDTEMLVAAPACGRAAMEPVVLAELAELAPLKLVVPAAGNVRRRNLQQYLETNGVQVERVIEMDAMLGTLEFVARSDWVTILPGLILVADKPGAERVVNPIVRPQMHAEFVVIEPARRTLTPQAGLFLEQIREQVNAISRGWREAGIASSESD